MKHSDFAIGCEFLTATGRWRCTDVGTRTVAALKLDHDGDPSWYNGPPYAVAETSFDEYDFGGCNPASAERAYDNSGAISTLTLTRSAAHAARARGRRGHRVRAVATNAGGGDDSGEGIKTSAICPLCGVDPRIVVARPEGDGGVLPIVGHGCHCMYKGGVRIAIGICCGRKLGEETLADEDESDARKDAAKARRWRARTDLVAPKIGAVIAEVHDGSPIYTVTMLSAKRSGSDRHTWGWHQTRETAEAAMRAGAGLLFEGGTFEYAVIEEVRPGLDTRRHAAWWFRAEHQGDDVYVIRALPTPPEFAANICDFSMG
jgi:hypothetical protein